MIEFKVGYGNKHQKNAIDQVEDYALDLKNFHGESHERLIIPLLVSTKSTHANNTISKDADGIFKPALTNKDNVGELIQEINGVIGLQPPINSEVWENSVYKPTPTIIEAAQALYQGHDVKDISRSDSGAINLSITSNKVNQIIDHAKHNNEKVICFVTGVPGAGKTLAGLNIANTRHNFKEEEHAVFLSRNRPLVKVLKEALARNRVKTILVLKNLQRRKKLKRLFKTYTILEMKD
ncbi:DNA/RNA helicase domain-containing protein [Priestia megaterium]